MNAYKLTNSEILLLLEVALISLNSPASFEKMCDELDIDDTELEKLRLKLEKEMSTHQEPNLNHL